MGNGYNHQFQYQHNLHKSTFLPMLCSRTAIRDVALPRLEDRSASFSDDPLSPKIGCMGQVKRNNKIIGFPSTSHNKLSLATKNNNNDVKYLKLKRLFSGKNLTASSNNNTSCRANSCRIRRELTVNGVMSKPKVGDQNKERESCINIAEMDPPLPVIRRVPKPADTEDENSLWKRRSSGGALKTLELQHIKVPRHQVEISTV